MFYILTVTDIVKSQSSYYSESLVSKHTLACATYIHSHTLHTHAYYLYYLYSNINNHATCKCLCNTLNRFLHNESYSMYNHLIFIETMGFVVEN